MDMSYVFVHICFIQNFLHRFVVSLLVFCCVLGAFTGCQSEADREEEIGEIIVETIEGMADSSQEWVYSARSAVRSAQNVAVSAGTPAERIWWSAWAEAMAELADEALAWADTPISYDSERVAGQFASLMERAIAWAEEAGELVEEAEVRARSGSGSEQEAVRSANRAVQRAADSAEGAMKLLAIMIGDEETLREFGVTL